MITQKPVGWQLFLLDPGCGIETIILTIHWWSNSELFFISEDMNETACSGYRLSNHFAQTRRLLLWASVRSWALFFLKHLSFRSWRMMLWTDDFVMPVSLAIWRTVLCVFGASSWLNARSSTSLMFMPLHRPLPGLQSADPVVSIWCNRRFNEACEKFFPGNSVVILLAPYPFSTLRTLIKTLIFFWQHFVYQQNDVMRDVSGVRRA